MKRITALLAFTTVLVGACGKNEKTTEDSIKTQILKLSHNHATGYPVDIAYQKFAELVNKNSAGRYEVEIYPSAQLGESKASVELAQSGVLQFGHINSAALEGFDNIYSILNLPYVFKDYEHYKRVMDSPEVRDIFEASSNQGFVTLIYLEGGARSFYTKSKAIKIPTDLAGMKIRVQDSPTHIKMIQRLGGTPVILNFSEVYTSLQQGVIDGAENNAPSLVQTGHGEVAKYFSLNEHLRLSDFLVVGAKFWSNLSEEDRAMFRKSANETIEYFGEVWAASEIDSFTQAKEKYNIAITEVDITPFRDLVLPLQDEVAATDPKFKKLLDHIRALEQ